MVERSPFKISREFNLLWFAQVFSSAGEYLFLSTATVWVVSGIYPRSPDLPSLVAGLVLATSIPRIAVGPLVGVFVDRWDPRRTLIACDVLRFLFYGTFAGITRLAPGSKVLTALIIAVILLSSTVAQFFNPSRAAAIQVVIPDERREDAAGLSLFSVTGIAVASTAAGPAIFAAAGGAAAASLSALCFLFSWLTILRLRVIQTKALDRDARYWHSLIEGLKLAWSSPELRLVVIGTGVYGVSLGVNNSVLALFALKTLMLQPIFYGYLAAIFPLGNLIGALASPHLVKRIGVHRGYTGGLMILGLVYSVYALNRSVLVAFILMLLAGVAFSILITSQGPLLQRAVPEGFMGRITAVTGPTMALSSVLATVASARVLSFSGERGESLNQVPVSAYGFALLAGSFFLLTGGAVLLRATSMQARNS